MSKLRIMLNLLIIIVLAVSVLANVSPSFAQTEQAGIVRGTVMHDGAPLVGVEVFLGIMGVLTLVVGAMNVLIVPFGTALAVYTFWVLTQEESTSFFD